MKLSQIALIGLGLSAITVTADHGKGGKGKGKGKGYKEYRCDGPRKVKFEEKKDGFEIKAGAEEKKCHDELKFKLKLKDGAEMHLKIYKRGGPGDRSKFEIKQKVYEVIEFQDENDNNIVEADEIVQKLKIGGYNKWSEIKYNETDGVHTVDASADWFHIQARYSGYPKELVKSENRTYNLHPNAVKVDYIIDGFPYLQDDTKLAVDGRFRTKAKIYGKKKYYSKKGKKVPGKYVEEIELHGNSTEGEGGKFTWARNVTADGNVVAVVSSPTEDAPEDEADKPGKGEKNKRIVWVFDQAGQVEKFVWDPTLTGEEANVYEKEEDDTSGASSTIPTMAASLFAAALYFAF